MSAVRIILALIPGIMADRAELASENLALRRQQAVLSEQKRRPRLRKRDRIFRAWLSRFWSNWRSVLVMVQPETVVHWHQRSSRLDWRWKSRSGKVRRATIDAAMRQLIRRTSRENPLRGTPRIQSELRLLGCQASKATVNSYKVRYRKPPSQTWRTFLDKHVRKCVAVDFFSVHGETHRIDSTRVP